MDRPPVSLIGTCDWSYSIFLLADLCTQVRVQGLSFHLEQSRATEINFPRPGGQDRKKKTRGTGTSCFLFLLVLQ